VPCFTDWITRRIPPRPLATLHDFIRCPAVYSCTLKGAAPPNAQSPLMAMVTAEKFEALDMSRWYHGEERGIRCARERGMVRKAWPTSTRSPEFT
jgi:hypothetical protein